MFVAGDVQSYSNKNDLFNLGTKFKDAHIDIRAAGNCLVLGQGTASVMHLARAMEPTLHHLAKRTGVNIGPRDSWGKILNAMDGKIKKMSDATTKQQARKDKWSEAYVRLGHVKNAWRDRPMHAKQDFTPSQARDVMNAVRVFMTDLASL